MRKISENAQRLQTLVEELNVLSSDLASAHADFNRATDSNMIEAAIFAVNGLHSRYDFVLRQIKLLPDEPHDTPDYQIPVYSNSRRLSIE